MTSPVQAAEFGFTESAGITPAGSSLVKEVPTINADKDYGPFPTAGGPYLRILYALAVGAARAKVRVKWYNDEALAVFLGADEVISAPGNGNGIASIPVRGNFVVITATAQAYPATVAIEAYLTQNATQEDSDFNLLINTNGLATGAGITQTLNASESRGGMGFWRAGFDGAAAAGLIRLYVTDVAGNQYLLDACGPDLATNGGGRLIPLPNAPLQIVATNGGGVARNLYASLSFQAPPL